MLKRHMSERGSSITNTRFGKVTLMLPITPRMISQDTDYSCFSWFNLPKNKNKNKTKIKQKKGHTTFWNASMLSPWSLLLCLCYTFMWGAKRKKKSLPSIAFTDSWVFFWAWGLFTCLDLVSVEEEEWGQGGDGRSGSEGIKCSVGGLWDSADWSIRQDAVSWDAVKQLQRQLFPGCVSVSVCVPLSLWGHPSHFVMVKERLWFIISLCRTCEKAVSKLKGGKRNVSHVQGCQTSVPHRGWTAV